jgi:hypothetical protein
VSDWSTPGKVKVPTIHLNGSSGDELLRQNIEARKALRRAIEALEAAAPNARDYYVQDDDAHLKAVGEHVLRLGHLRDVMEELSEIIESIDEQLSKRRSR